MSVENKLCYLFSKIDNKGNYLSWNGGTYSKDSHGKMIVNLDTIKRHILYDMIITKKIDMSLDTVIIEKFDVRYNKLGENEVDLFNIVPNINELFKIYDKICNTTFKNNISKYRKNEFMKEVIRNYVDGFDISFISAYQVEDVSTFFQSSSPSYIKLKDYLDNYNDGSYVRIPKYYPYGNTREIFVLFDSKYDPIKERLTSEMPFTLVYEK